MRKGNLMDIFGISVPTPVFWVIIAVIVIAIIAIIVVPMYKGYKKEMEKPVKKSSGKKTSSGKSTAKKK